MKPMGRTQWIVVGALAAPFLVISGALFTGKASVEDWSGFLQVFFPSIVIPLLVGGLGVKFAKGKGSPTSQDGSGDAQG